MGSGHILVYAFDVFMQLYEAEGQSPRTASELILENNLFGLDIDQRAFQLAYFALMMKGRQYSRRILSKQLRPNVYVVPNNSDIGEAELQLVQMQFNDQKKAQQDLLTLAEGFKTGAELGSLIKFEGLDFENLKSGLNNTNVSFFDQSIKEMILVGELLQQQYEIGITNPPYMGSSGMDKILSGYVKKIYPDSKSDLFGVFVERLEEMVKSTGYYAMITQHAWMFLSSFEKLRIKINQQTIINMAHLGTRAFEEIGGEVVQTTAFVMTPKKYKNYIGSYLRLVDFENYKLKEIKALYAISTMSADYLYRTTQFNFLKIPGQPISYWVSENIYQNFIEKKISTYGEVKSGIMVNSRYILEWFEVNISDIQLNGQIISDMDDYRWFPLNSGGGFRKWYGNNGPIIDLENNGQRVKKAKNNYRLRNSDYYFKKGITWGRITSSNISFRWSRQGNLFGDAGPMIFIDNDDDLKLILGLSNTKVMLSLTNVLNPTINFQVDDFNNIPVIQNNNYKEKINEIVTTCVEISKLDESFCESSWDFNRNPLV